MAALTSNTIASTYLTLLKLTSAALGADASGKYIEDAAGTDSALSLSTTRVGIGTDTPGYALEVEGTGNDETRVISVKGEGASSSDGGGVINLSSDDGDVMVSGHRLGMISFMGADSGSAAAGENSLDQGASIYALAEGTWDADSNAAGLSFATAPEDNSNTAPQVRMRIDKDGNVGIGTVAPTALLTVEDPSGAIIHLLRDDADTDIADGNVLGKIVFGGDDPVNQTFQLGAEIRAEAAENFDTNQCGSDIVFKTASKTTASTTLNARMTITADGNVGIGAATPANLLHVAGATNAYISIDADKDGAGTNDAALILAEAGTQQWIIINDGGNTNRIGILDAGSDDGVIMAQGGTAFADIGSDERAKTDLVVISDAIDKVNTLRAVNYKWKYGNEKRRTRSNVGLIAQDVYKVLPEACIIPEREYEVIDHPIYEGEKQAQGMWTYADSKVVPLLVKAIQELSAKVEALENA